MDKGRSVVRAGLTEATQKHLGVSWFPSRQVLCTSCDQALPSVLSAERQQSQHPYVGPFR